MSPHRAPRRRWCCCGQRRVSAESMPAEGCLMSLRTPTSPCQSSTTSGAPALLIKVCHPFGFSLWVMFYVIEDAESLCRSFTTSTALGLRTFPVAYTFLCSLYISSFCTSSGVSVLLLLLSTTVSIRLLLLHNQWCVCVASFSDLVCIHVSSCVSTLFRSLSPSHVNHVACFTSSQHCCSRDTDPLHLYLAYLFPGLACRPPPKTHKLPLLLSCLPVSGPAC